MTVAVLTRGRLVRALFGHGAIQERKLEHGDPLTVLGIRIEVNDAGVVFQPDQDKVQMLLHVHSAR